MYTNGLLQRSWYSLGYSYGAIVNKEFCELQHEFILFNLLSLNVHGLKSNHSEKHSKQSTSLLHKYSLFWVQ